MVRAALTCGELKEALLYDEVTGVFTWRVSICRRMKIGSVAGFQDRYGYIQIQYRERIYLAHRLAWLYMTGEWPKAQIDHIDGNRSFNAFVNLRDVDQSTNMQNQRVAQSRSKSGLLGVHFEKATGRWRAQISLDGKNVMLGRFDEPLAAHNAYITAKRIGHRGCNI